MSKFYLDICFASSNKLYPDFMTKLETVKCNDLGYLDAIGINQEIFEILQGKVTRYNCIAKEPPENIVSKKDTLIKDILAECYARNIICMFHEIDENESVDEDDYNFIYGTSDGNYFGGMWYRFDSDATFIGIQKSVSNNDVKDTARIIITNFEKICREEGYTNIETLPFDPMRPYLKTLGYEEEETGGIMYKELE